MARPKIMMLDEPSLGLAPIIVTQIFEILTTINKELNTTILVVEQKCVQGFIYCASWLYDDHTVQLSWKARQKNCWKTKILKRCILDKQTALDRSWSEGVME